MGELRRKAALYVAALKPYQKPLRLAWDVLNLGVIGLNSFILLYFKCGYGDGMNQVVCFGGTAYAFVLLVQTVFLRKMPEKRQKAVYQTKKIFRLIYTALYLTVIMLNVISVTEVSAEGDKVLLSYYGFLFIWVSVWGTNCLWLRRAAEKAAEWHRRRNMRKEERSDAPASLASRDSCPASTTEAGRCSSYSLSILDKNSFRSPEL